MVYTGARGRDALLHIDGSYGEGGGQVLRTAVSLAALTGSAVRIDAVRGGRANPGLRPQHLTAVKAAASVCGADVEGADIGSQTLSFTPHHAPRAGDYRFDVAAASKGGSAGSVALVLQTALVSLARAQGCSIVRLKGGTHVPWSPSLFYLENVYGPALGQIGVRLHTELRRWGFYPAGGGEAHFEVDHPAARLRPLRLVDRGPLEVVFGVAVAMNLPSHIPQRMSNRALSVLAQSGLPARVDALRVRGTGPGAAIFLAARYANAVAGACAYGRRGLTSEEVADAACRELLEFHRSGAPVDPHLADQLLVPLALAEGRSELIVAHVSNHLQTNAWAVQQFLESDIRTEPGPSGRTRVIVEGIGL
jgi:RNA 3'-terminal phosphate cyclase (ATP)